MLQLQGAVTTTLRGPVGWHPLLRMALPVPGFIKKLLLMVTLRGSSPKLILMLEAKAQSRNPAVRVQIMI